MVGRPQIESKNIKKTDNGQRSIIYGKTKI